MEHYVYCAALCDKNKVSNEAALRAVNNLESQWESNLINAGCGYPGIKILVTEDFGNLTILFESTIKSNSTFINACMSFAREQLRLEQILSNTKE